MNRKITYTPPDNWEKITTIDMHTGGEPLRILVDGLPEIKGRTILDKRRYFKENLDHIRTSTMFEPRGHADMYGAVVTEPVRNDSDFGTFFMHNEGYSTMCGHATIALTKMAIECGLVEYTEGEHIRIDAPPGRLLASARMENDKIVSCSFINVPSYTLITNEVIKVDGIGIVRFDLAYGGAYYAICEAEDFGFQLMPEEHHKLIDYGRRIKKAIASVIDIEHPFEKDLGFLYGTIFVGKPHSPANQSRNVCVFADGEIDRSATGSGVSARAALMHTRGEMKAGQTFRVESIIGTTMDVRITKTEPYGNMQAVVPEVSGSAYFTGTGEFWFDPEDPLKNGFIIR
jgi:trans-L-3-hydroxyproline dehydratase